MPKREDESWAGQKEDLRYCTKHNRYYDVRYGCQLCYLEDLPAKRKGKEVSQLQQCPRCKHESLLWNRDRGSHECLNRDCEKWHLPAGDESLSNVGVENGPRGLYPFKTSFEKSGTRDESTREHPSPGKAWFGNEYFDAETKRWKKPKTSNIRWGRVLLAFLAATLIVGAAAIAHGIWKNM